MSESKNRSKARSQRTVDTVKMDDFTKSFVNSLNENIKASVKKDMSILRKYNILCK